MQEKLRVLMMSPQFRPIVGGYERAAERLSSELVRHGHEVTVIAERRNGSWPAREQRDGVMVQRLWCLYRPHLHHITSLAAFALFLFTLGWRFHVWHIHQYGVHAVLAVMLGKLLHRPVVLTLTSSKDQGIHQASVNMTLASLACAWLRKVDAVAALSQEMRDEAQAFGIQADRVYVMGNGVDTQIFHPRSNDERINLRRQLKVEANGMVVFVGRLAKEKNPDGLLHAWQMALPHLFEGWKLVLVGDGPMRGELEAFVDERRLRDTVLFTGLQANVESWLGAADVYVLASHREGLSNAMLEAMAIGLPVVSTRVSGVRETVEEAGAGLVVDVGQKEQLADALIRLANDSLLRSQMGRAGRAVILKSYSLNHVAVLHEQLYDKLLAGKSKKLRVV
jgi:glycosyltransferase involved in cell wall biosynthesis